MGEKTESYITSVTILDEKNFPLKTKLSFVSWHLPVLHLLPKKGSLDINLRYTFFTNNVVNFIYYDVINCALSNGI